MIGFITRSQQLIDFESIITPSMGSLMRDLEETKNTYISLDIESTGKHPRYNRPLLIGIRIPDAETVSYIVDLVTTPKEEIIALLKLIVDLDLLIIAHNASFDISMLWYHYGILLEKVWCTMVVEQVLFNGVDSYRYGYAHLCKRYIGYTINKDDVKSFIDRDTSLPFTLREIKYLAADIRHLPAIRNKQLLDIHKKELSETIALEMRFLPKKVKMEMRGIDINREAWLKIAKKKNIEKAELKVLMTKELVKLDSVFKYSEQVSFLNKSAQLDLFNPNPESLAELNIAKININSPKQLMEVLNACGGNFESTGIDVLHQKLRDNKDEPYAKFLEFLVDYRSLEKATSTYGEGFLENMDKITGRLHTSFTQAFTSTGRLSSSAYSALDNKKEGTNLQNIKSNKEYRNCFIASSEDRSIITADFGGQEIVLAAHQSQDPLLLAAVKDGLDIHSHMAQQSFRIITGDPDLMISKTVNPQYRKIHKNVLFALFYGAGPARIADTLNVSIEIATAVYKKLRVVLSKFMIYQDKIKADILAKYQVRDHSYTNRVRFFEKLFDGEVSLHKAEKEASNFPIQSSGASMIKEAICDMDDYFIEESLNCEVLFTVHDEIIVESPFEDKYRDIVINIMKKTAQKYIGDLPISVDAEQLPYWTK